MRWAIWQTCNLRDPCCAKLHCVGAKLKQGIETRAQIGGGQDSEGKQTQIGNKDQNHSTRAQIVGGMRKALITV